MKRPLTAGAVALACLVALSGCAGIPAATVVLATQAGLAAASNAYCSGTTDDAKRAVRDRLTGGVAVIPCAPSAP
ncbi:hypothetical protein [Thalassobaculum sp.]|uniref:hypothetical protein n=1 Tax=Thalassobaculum sp. TaxID=2022740 RepID=UPI0032EFF4B6